MHRPLGPSPRRDHVVDFIPTSGLSFTVTPPPPPRPASFTGVFPRTPFETPVAGLGPVASGPSTSISCETSDANPRLSSLSSAASLDASGRFGDPASSAPMASARSRRGRNFGSSRSGAPGPGGAAANSGTPRRLVSASGVSFELDPNAVDAGVWNASSSGGGYSRRACSATLLPTSFNTNQLTARASSASRSPQPRSADA